MNNCLVTKLNAVVNDDTLPIIETMQQFTLDAIAASGNSSMTDEQKLALNHFFYQIGAISQDELWSKINVLLIPMLATPVEGYTTYLVHDYKANTVAIPESDKFTGVNGGLQATVNINRPLNVPSVFVNSDSSSIIFMESPGHSMETSTVSYIRYVYDDTTEFLIGSVSSSSFFTNRIKSGLTYNMRIPFTDGPKVLDAINLIGTPWNHENAWSCIYNTNGERIVSTNHAADSAAFVDHTGSSVSSTEIWLSPGSVLGLVISFTESLTASEMDKVCNAALALRSAFGY